MAIDPLQYLLNATLDNDQWDPTNAIFDRTDPEARRQTLIDSAQGANLVNLQRGMQSWQRDVLAQRVARADALAILDQMLSHSRMTPDDPGVGSGGNYVTALQKYIRNPDEAIPGAHQNVAAQLYAALADKADTAEFDPTNGPLADALSSRHGRDAIGTLLVNEAGRKYGGFAKRAAEIRIADASARAANTKDNPFQWLKEIAALGPEFSAPAVIQPAPAIPGANGGQPAGGMIGQTPGQYGGITVTDADFQERKKDASGLPTY